MSAHLACWRDPATRDKVIVLSWSLFLIILLAVQYSRGIQISNDTIDYTNGSFHRSPLYPLVLDILRLGTGSYGHSILITTQFILGGAAVYSLSAFLISRYRLPVWVFCIVSYLLLRPYITGEGRVGNFILTEGMAYPLFLYAARWMFDAITSRERRPFYVFLGFVCALVLTRKQFLFMYPLVAVMLGYLWLRTRDLRRILPLGVAFVVCVTSAALLERANNAVRHGAFTAIPATGIQLVAAPLYVSDETNGGVLADRDQSELFALVFPRLQQRNLIWAKIKEFTPRPERPQQHYLLSYGAITFGTVVPAACDLFAHGDCTGIGTWMRIDKVTTGMALPLIRANFGKYLALYRDNVKRGFRGPFLKDDASLYVQLFLLLVSGVFLALKPRWVHEIVFFSTLAHAMNVLLVALVEPTLGRYMLYTGHLQNAVILLALVPAIAGLFGQKRGAVGTGGANDLSSPGIA